MKTPCLTYRFGCRPISDGLNFLLINLDTLCSYNIAKKHNFLHAKGTLFKISIQFLTTQHIKYITDVDQPKNTSKDPLHVPNGPMTRSKIKALNALVLNVSTKSELKGPLEYQGETLEHLIHVQEGSNTTLFGP
jgi:hypothetical protein